MVVKLDVQKSLGAGQMYWTNRYLLDYADPSAVPSGEFNAIVAGERAMHSNLVQFVSLRISDIVEGTDNYIVWPLTGTGGVIPTGNPLPGWVTYRVDFGFGAGRPGRKYYRVYVGEGQQNGNVWETSYRGDVQALMNTMIAAAPSICSPDGVNVITAVAKNELQMRQLRRGTKRPLTPVIPVA